MPHSFSSCRPGIEPTTMNEIKDIVTVWAWGSNGSGQLGVGHLDDVNNHDVTCFADKPSTPLKVVGGGNHTLFLARDGQVHWAGDNTTGACGVGEKPEQERFTLMKYNPQGHDIGPVVLAAATWAASFLVVQDDDGLNTKLYALGTGDRGELGLGQHTRRTDQATQIPDFPPVGLEIVDIHACLGHVIVVLSDGSAYGWGNCRKGQIGGAHEYVWTPRRITEPGFPVAKAVCCKDTSLLYGHSGDGMLLVLGSDRWGLCSDAPTRIPSYMTVGATWNTAFILTDDGELLGWGRNIWGLLPPPGTGRLQKLACGSEHVIALDVEGRVVGWGWNEHGNIGEKRIADSSDTKTLLKSDEIEEGKRVGALAAGCATSFIILDKV